MNTLDLNSDDEYESFDLVVDGQRMSDLLKDGNDGIPFWIVDTELPTFPPHDTRADARARIVSVCACGEYGCSYSRCDIEQAGDAVTFSNFQGAVGARGRDLKFVFAANEYAAVRARIAALAAEYRQRHG